MTSLLNESIELLTTARKRLHQETLTHTEVQPMDSNHPELTPQQASEMYTGGKSVIEIARAFGLTYAKTRKILALTNTPIRDASSRLKGRTRTSTSVNA